jgi:hypothetical protein
VAAPDFLDAAPAQANGIHHGSCSTIASRRRAVRVHP